jgi:uroporphyrinogen-III synthase
MITSASVFEVLENKKELFLELFDHPCYCVGEATGEAAHRFGFTEIRNGDSDSAQLAKKIIDDGATTKRLLHISGDIADNKAHDILAPKGVELIPWPVYHARAATDFSRETTNAFRAGEINAILLFSPRSAQILVSLLQKSGLVQSCFSIAAIALSQAVANMLKNIPWRELRVATAPTEEAVLTCLGKRPDDTDGTTT